MSTQPLGFPSSSLRRCQVSLATRSTASLRPERTSERVLAAGVLSFGIYPAWLVPLLPLRPLRPRRRLRGAGAPAMTASSSSSNPAAERVRPLPSPSSSTSRQAKRTIMLVVSSRIFLPLFPPRLLALTAAAAGARSRRRRTSSPASAPTSLASLRMSIGIVVSCRVDPCSLSLV